MALFFSCSTLLVPILGLTVKNAPRLYIRYHVFLPVNQKLFLRCIWGQIASSSMTHYHKCPIWSPPHTEAFHPACCRQLLARNMHHVKKSLLPCVRNETDSISMSKLLQITREQRLGLLRILQGFF